MGQITWLELLQLVGLPALGTGTAIGVAAFIGKGWIKAQFDKGLEGFKSEQVAKLEAFKATQAQQLERVRFELNSSHTRASKVLDTRFLIYPEIWRLTQKAVTAVADYIALFRQVVNVGALNESDRQLLYTRKKYTQFEIERLEGSVGSPDSWKIVKEIDDNYRRRTAVRHFLRFQKYLNENGIFIEPHLRGQLRKIEELMKEAIYEHEDDKEGLLEDRSSAERLEARRALEKQWKEIRVEIEKSFQASLTGLAPPEPKSPELSPSD